MAEPASVAAFESIRRLEGARVVLAPFAERHITGAYLKWLRNAEVNRFLIKAASDITNESITAFCRTMINSPIDYFFAILVKQNDKPRERHIGNVRLGPVDEVESVAGFGIMIGDTAFQGRGFAIETVNLIKAFGFDELGLGRFSFPVVREHEAAIRLYQRCGFELMGSWSKPIEKAGRRFDAVEMSLAKPS